MNIINIYMKYSLFMFNKFSFQNYFNIKHKNVNQKMSENIGLNQVRKKY